LLKEVQGISGKMLSRELKDLEMNELIERDVLNTTPVAVAYRITDYGKSLKQLTNTIADWGLSIDNASFLELRKIITFQS
jgi:DNA-binding HxlR family transcriptional regulator